MAETSHEDITSLVEQLKTASPLQSAFIAKKISDLAGEVKERRALTKAKLARIVDLYGDHEALTDPEQQERLKQKIQKERDSLQASEEVELLNQLLSQMLKS